MVIFHMADSLPVVPVSPKGVFIVVLAAMEAVQFAACGVLSFLNRTSLFDAVKGLRRPVDPALHRIASLIGSFDMRYDIW